MELVYDKSIYFALQRCLTLDGIYRLQNRCTPEFPEVKEEDE